MRRRIAIAVISASFLGAGAGVLVGRPSHSATTAKIPPVCVVKQVGPLHIQVGYCP